MLKLKRAYEPVTQADGVRFLVERLWRPQRSRSRAGCAPVRTWAIRASKRARSTTGRPSSMKYGNGSPRRSKDGTPGSCSSARI